jgi:diguanylate cyclase
MQSQTRVYSLPRWRLTRWLADCGPGVPDDIRIELIANLFGNLPIFFGGVINTVAVAAAVALRKPAAPFIAWLAFEIVVCTARLIVLVIARRAALRRAETPTDVYLILGIAWSVSVSYGVVVSLASRDFMIATVACLSAAAMVGGICFRNFSAPRFAATMIVISLGSTVPGALLAGDPVFYVVVMQVPLYFGAMSAAVFTLNRMLVATMRAERENSRRASHDALTGLLNREGLIETVGAELVAAAAAGQPRALLFLDLDNFKTVKNEVLGCQLVGVDGDVAEPVADLHPVLGRVTTRSGMRSATSCSKQWRTASRPNWPRAMSLPASAATNSWCWPLQRRKSLRLKEASG